MSVHSRRAALALARLPEVDPAIAALALWCAFRDTDAPTRTEGETILIGPEFPLLPISEQTGLISHHVLHVALRHSARRGAAQDRFGAGFSPMHYDLACDALVNEALLQGGHALPRPAVRAAEIAALMPPDSRPDNVLSEWDSDTLYLMMVAQSGRQGGAQDDAFQGYAQRQGFQADLGSSPADQTEAAIWAGRITQAMSAGRQAGTGIGAVHGGFGDLPKATVPWEVRLRRLLAKALAHHPQPSHRRPARTWLARDALARQQGGVQPVFEPGMTRDKRRPRLVIGLDTSSSIPKTTLDLFAAEAISAVRRLGAEAHLLGFDTEVHTRVPVSNPARISALAMREGGGTDFAPVLAEAEALSPSLTILLTDLDAPVPRAIATPLLWCVAAAPSTLPQIGDVLVMEDGPRALP